MSYRPIVTVSPSGICGGAWKVEYKCHDDVANINQPSVAMQDKGDKTVIQFQADGGGKSYFHETQKIPNGVSAQMKISKGSISGNKYTVKISGADPSEYYR